MLPRRPFLVTLLALGVLNFTVLQFARFYLAIKQWSFIYMTLNMGMATYIALTGFVWTLISIILLPGLWRGKYWARRLTLSTAALFTLYYWFDRLIISRGDSDTTNLVFTIIVNFLTIVIIVWILYRQDSKAFFGDAHDR